MLCCAMLCYAVLCYAMLCYAMLCHAMLCYAMLCYAMLRHAMLCYALLCYAMLRDAMLYYAMLCYAMLCYATLSSPSAHSSSCFWLSSLRMKRPGWYDFVIFLQKQTASVQTVQTLSEHGSAKLLSITFTSREVAVNNTHFGYAYFSVCFVKRLPFYVNHIFVIAFVRRTLYTSPPVTMGPCE